jgi:hypothetical protein
LDGGEIVMARIRSLESCISIDEDDVKQYIKYNYSPEDIFDDDALHNWAMSHGYIEETKGDN